MSDAGRVTIDEMAADLYYQQPLDRERILAALREAHARGFADLADAHSCALQAAADIASEMLDDENSTDGLDIDAVLRTIRHEILTTSVARINTFVASDLTLTEEPS